MNIQSYGVPVGKYTVVSRPKSRVIKIADGDRIITIVENVNRPVKKPVKKGR